MTDCKQCSTCAARPPMGPYRHVIIWPNGRVDPALFNDEKSAAEEGARAFDVFTVAKIVPVATYRVHNVLIRKEAR